MLVLTHLSGHLTRKLPTPVGLKAYHHPFKKQPVLSSLAVNSRGTLHEFDYHH